MKIIKIDKLEDLNNYTWKFRDRDFELIKQHKESFNLFIKNWIDSTSLIINQSAATISLKNLSELEFYGLKVIMNEKPKLMRNERDFLEIHDIDTYIARDESGLLVIGSTEPIQENDYWEWEENKLYMSGSAFPFITWESGKAWSKAELMELEVVE